MNIFENSIIISKILIIFGCSILIILFFILLAKNIISVLYTSTITFSLVLIFLPSYTFIVL